MEPVNAFFFGMLALAAAGTGWWIHRSRLAALRQQLREAQDSQLEFAEAAATLHRRLAEADQALAATTVPGDIEQRRAVLTRALAAAAPPQASWEDTHPLTVPGFQETQPSALDETTR
jgi:hypothetical protein